MSNEVSKMQEVLYKYFRDERTIDFIAADRFTAEYGQPTLSYSYLRGDKSAVVVTIQLPDYDETPIKSCHTAEELENLLQSILYNFIPKPPRDRSREFEWLRENRDKYDGLYVALIGDRLLASGDDAKAVFQEAGKIGYSDALIIYVQGSNHPPFIGGAN